MTDIFIFGFGMAVCLIVGSALVTLVVQANRAVDSAADGSSAGDAVRPALVVRDNWADDRGA